MSLEEKPGADTQGDTGDTEAGTEECRPQRGTEVVRQPRVHGEGFVPETLAVFRREQHCQHLIAGFQPEEGERTTCWSPRTVTQPGNPLVPSCPDRGRCVTAVGCCELTEVTMPLSYINTCPCCHVCMGVAAGLGNLTPVAAGFPSSERGMAQLGWGSTAAHSQAS